MISVAASSDSGADIYDTLKPAPDQPKEGFRVNEEEGTFYLTKGFSLPSDIYENLFEHQKTGVTWLYKLYLQGKGGVLGDDMGLGKTV